MFIFLHNMMIQRAQHVPTLYVSCSNRNDIFWNSPQEFECSRVRFPQFDPKNPWIDNDGPNQEKIHAKLGFRRFFTLSVLNQDCFLRVELEVFYANQKTTCLLLTSLLLRNPSICTKKFSRKKRVFPNTQFDSTFLALFVPLGYWRVGFPPQDDLMIWRSTCPSFLNAKSYEIQEIFYKMKLNF